MIFTGNFKIHTLRQYMNHDTTRFQKLVFSPHTRDVYSLSSSFSFFHQREKQQLFWTQFDIMLLPPQKKPVRWSLFLEHMFTSTHLSGIPRVHGSMWRITEYYGTQSLRYRRGSQRATATLVLLGGRAFTTKIALGLCYAAPRCFLYQRIDTMHIDRPMRANERALAQTKPSDVFQT